MTSATPKPRAGEVCDVCGGRKSACDVLGHRQPGDKTQWQENPRAGEHTWHDDKMLILALRDEVDALAAQLETCKAAHISNCLDADKLRAQKRELREALEGILAAADNSLGIWTPMIEPFKIARAALAKVCA